MKTEVEITTIDYGRNYFNKHLGAVENFTEAELIRNKNWFSGWLNYLDKYVDLKDGRGRRVLEVGCAIAAPSSLLAERGFEVFASDISSYAISKAKKLSPTVRFFTFDIQKDIPIGSKFDLILAFELLEHLLEPEKAVKNMYEKLAHKGYLVCSTPFPYKRYISLPAHVNVLYPNQWRSIFEKAGFWSQNLQMSKVSFTPLLYRFHKFFSKAIPFGLDLPYINSTVFIIAQKI